MIVPFRYRNSNLRRRWGDDRIDDDGEEKEKRKRDINWDDIPESIAPTLYISKCPLIGRIFRSIKQIVRVDLYLLAKFSTINDVRNESSPHENRTLS